MKLCRFQTSQGIVGVGLIDRDHLFELAPAGVGELRTLLELENLPAELERLSRAGLPGLKLKEVRLCAPVDRQEIWAAGVTYQRSKVARMEESSFSARAYDSVYAAPRPELFFKSLGQKTVGPEEAVGIRQDARWNVPEPELALVFNSRGQIVGHTVGNDMSSRDIEGENLLYLPQAKIYNRSCALGPWICIGATEEEARTWSVRIHVHRGGNVVFEGETSVSQIKRNFDELAGYLFRSQSFPDGAILLTGTGIVPPESFTLEEHDSIEIEISGVGVLRNSVMRV